MDGSLPLNRELNNEGWVFSVFVLCLFIQRMQKEGTKTALKTLKRVTCLNKILEKTNLDDRDFVILSRGTI